MTLTDGKNVKITIIVDNHAGDGLVAEHGFALWIETQGKQILFDTGQGHALLANSRALGIDLRQTDLLVLSHGHYDHTGGVYHVLQAAPKVTVYAHPQVLIDRYSVRDTVAKKVSMDNECRTLLECRAKQKMHWVTRKIELLPGVELTGPIARRTHFEDSGGPFFLDPLAKQADPLHDDQALWIHSPKGLLLIVGCSHAGIINTISQALEQTGQNRIHMILGGMHLLNAGEERLQITLAALADAAEHLYPCHCTGDAVVQKMRQALPDQTHTTQAGLLLDF